MSEETNEKMSLSKQRKLAKQKEIAKIKRNRVIGKVVLVAVILAIVGVAAWLIARYAIKKSKEVTADTNYSAQIDDNGMIKNVKAADYVTVPDYNNMTVAKADIEYSDEKVESDIQTILDNNKTLQLSPELVAKDGDKVNIDYVGKIDGVEFDGGTADAYDLTLGSNKFIDDFEAQIVGHKPTDKFDVEVTFPEDYTNNPDLAGKDAVFSVSLNGIYVAPEFTDEFVQEKLSEYATTAEGYRQYLKDTNYESNLKTFVKDYLTNNTTVKSYPSAYLKQVKGNYKATEMDSYEYMTSLYTQYYGSSPYSSFTDYLSQAYSKTEEEYDESIEESVSSTMKYNLACQAIAEAEGITANIDEAREYYLDHGETEDDFNTYLEKYGKGYMVQSYLNEKVVKSLCDRVKVQ
ncbi:MAG: FKBP-type peptidyl-prolyl cis-trans isomerase [Lachnospiraceae bacterium]|nr:FKBP-type peptidyl-prolyl cis-trans isomerase [Lachnospiraceae bacterium]